MTRLQTSLAGRYEIERELGTGGMAIVYLARDLKHDRQVAVKLLRPELSAILGAERFLNEIRVTAHLQHPHILPLYDSGSAEGLLYYVMPYVEGESLRDRLNREKQLPVEEAVTLTRGVAGALDYAHRHDVVHRDIKPENILVHDGQALVADFGIALAVSAAGGSRLTETGLSLGTPHYMSPEQATGDRQLDGRSDLYSLACVTYEMLTGDPPHTGSTAQAIIAKIVTETPAPVRNGRPTVPLHVDFALQKALAKLPADRWATVSQFVDALDRPGTLPGLPAVAHAAPGAAGPARWGRPGLFAALTVVAMGVGVVLGRGTSPHAAPVSVTRFTLPLGVGYRLSDGPTSHMALSPDGSRLVYVATKGGATSQLYLRAMNSLTPTPIPGTEGGYSPFFSPDGAWLAFFADNQLKRINLSGGAALPIAPAPGGQDGTWTDGGRIVFSNAGGKLWSVAAEGGTPVVVASPDSATHQRELMLPAALPGGRAVIATGVRGMARGESDVVLVDLRTGAQRTVVRGRALQARYLPDGYLVYALDDGALLAAPFDLGKGALTGQPTAVLENVRTNFGRVAQFALSRSGTLVYVAEEPARVALVDRRGMATPVASENRGYHHLRFSPDGRRLVMDIAQPSGRDVWIRDLEQGTLTRASFEGDANDPVWTPDGQRVCFGTAKAGTRGVWCRRASGGGDAESLYVGPNETTAGAWTPDGKQLILIEDRHTGFDLLLLPAAGGRPTTLLSSQFDMAWPALSPDGRWLAYVSNESGKAQVYVRPFKGEGDRVQVSTDGGTEPVWARNGRELYFVTDQNWIDAAAVQTAPILRITSRTPLFDAQDYQTATPHANYDVDARGRFAMVLRSASSNAVVVQNWARELKPGGK